MVKLECQKTGLAIMSSYQHYSLKCHLSCDCEEYGYSVLYLNQLGRVINRLKEYKTRKLTLYDNNERLLIDFGKGETKLRKVTKYEKFLPVENIDNFKYSFMLPKNFEKIITKVSIAVGYGKRRYALTGIFFEINSDGMGVTSTDGHIICHIETKDTSLPYDNINLIIPKFTLSQALNCKCDKLVITGNRVYFLNTMDDTLIASPIIEGPYPNYRSSIPKNQSNRALLNTNECIRSTLDMNIFYFGDNLIMEGKDKYSGIEFTETLPIKYNGKPMQIFFNSYDVHKILNVINTNSFFWYFNSPCEATIIRPASTVFADEFYLLMPLKINKNIEMYY